MGQKAALAKACNWAFDPFAREPTAEQKAVPTALIGRLNAAIAAALGQPDPLKGELPIANVQRKPGVGVGTSSEELLALCRSQVVEQYTMLYDIIIVNEVAIIAVGKTFKRRVGSPRGAEAWTHLSQEAFSEFHFEPR